MSSHKFPDNFKWGSATSSHQVEGDNRNDWSEWEKSPSRISQLKKEGKDPADFISGAACDSYNRWGEDFDLAKELGHNIHRFSIEWSRIEPRQGEYNLQELEHYKTLIDGLRERGIEPMVTLWHFTNPIWFAEQGGWLNPESPRIFAKFARFLAENLKEKVGLWITFNEGASVYVTASYLRGEWPPQHRSIFEFHRARKNMAKAHLLAYNEIHHACSPKISSERSVSQRRVPDPAPMSHNVWVGLTENNAHIVFGKYFWQRWIGKIYDYHRNLWFWSAVLPHCDFLGLNYYNIDRRLPGAKEAWPNPGWMPEMSWETDPKGIYHRLVALKKLGKPIYITENGIADKTDNLREKYIKDHLYWIWKAIQEGTDVKGYMYWSLLDNFEWARGFAPRFGLIEIDYATYARKVRPSALEYAKICKSNTLNL